MPRKLFPSLVRFVNWQEESGGVGRVDDHRQPQLPAGLPNGVPAGIVDANQRAVRVLIIQPQLFEYLQSRCAAAFGIGQQLRRAAGEAGRWQSQVEGLLD